MTAQWDAAPGAAPVDGAACLTAGEHLKAQRHRWQECPVYQEQALPEDEPAKFSEAGIWRLASSLYVHVYNEQLSEDDEQAENYFADAREIAAAHPHLLSAAERWPDTPATRSVTDQAPRLLTITIDDRDAPENPHSPLTLNILDGDGEMLTGEAILGTTVQDVLAKATKAIVNELKYEVNAVRSYYAKDLAFRQLIDVAAALWIGTERDQITGRYLDGQAQTITDYMNWDVVGGRPDDAVELLQALIVDVAVRMSTPGQ